MHNLRQATHAGSWYTNDDRKLKDGLNGWLASVKSTDEFKPPIAKCRAIIAPHAGYSYSGSTAAWAYASIDKTGIKRVFVLGPSHHVHLTRCDVSGCEYYETPGGRLPVDKEINSELLATGKFRVMDKDTDEAEHSIEMHIPYVFHIFQGCDITVVPIMVGAIDMKGEESYGRILAPYLANPENFFVISSDFCHWGTRFHYTFYYPEPHPSDRAGVDLNHSHTTKSDLLRRRPIHESISDLDHEAMNILTIPRVEASAHQSHKHFSDYLHRTRNTICGRHPIGVLLGAFSALEEDGTRVQLEWVRYEQSSKCSNLRDSSVSYASAYATVSPAV